jgi:O-antigen ligase
LRNAPSILLGVTILLVAIAVDARTAAPFDAPKRLVLLLGIVMASVAAAMVATESRRLWSRNQRIAAGAALSGLLLAGLSAWASPHRAVALDNLRSIALVSLLVVLAARFERTWVWMRRGFLAGSVLNATLSCLQHAMGTAEVPWNAQGGRTTAFALVGNTGVLSLLCAMSIVLLIPRLQAKSLSAWILFVPLILALLLNRNVTAWIALAVACTVYVPALRRRLGVAALLVLVTVGATDTLGRIDRALTYRFGPWSAALAMTAERPLLGFGAGTFASEYAGHLAPRFANPAFAGAYALAHNDYLQSMAELGIPATIFLLIALGFVWRGARTEPVLAATIVLGVVCALTWFPLHRPESAGLLLAACGEAWRRS